MSLSFFCLALRLVFWFLCGLLFAPNTHGNELPNIYWYHILVLFGVYASLYEYVYIWTNNQHGHWVCYMLVGGWVKERARTHTSYDLFHVYYTSRWPTFSICLFS